RAVLVLPPHWQTAVWLMACWYAGLEAVPVDAADFEPGRLDGPYLLVAAEEVLDGMLTDTGAEEIVGLSLHALGGALAECPPGVVDYAIEVRAHGDRFVPAPGVTPETRVLSVTNTTLTGAELVEAARETAGKWALDAGDRVLVDMPFTTLDGLLVGLLAPLASGASVIIQRNFDESTLDRRITVEHVTAVAGAPGWNDATGRVRRLL
ncbi:TIGR03089 family protein, partial [Actinomadura adrarensis]